MKTFQSLFCAASHCEPSDFVRVIFHRCLYRHALPFVPFLGGYSSDYFASDRELIASAGRAVDLAQLREEIADFFLTSGNRSFRRKHLNLRISTSRLKRLAKLHLPGIDSQAPFPRALPSPAKR